MKKKKRYPDHFSSFSNRSDQNTQHDFDIPRLIRSKLGGQKAKD